MSDGALNIELLVHNHARIMALELSEIATRAGSEEDIRHECNKLIDDFLRQAGIKHRGLHEYGLAGGFIDSKYGGVIIEYKSPKGVSKLSTDKDSSGNKSVIKQIQKRFHDFREHENIEPHRLFAVGCDGRYIVFLRFRGGKFETEDPQPVTSHTVERLLRALISLGSEGKSFTPDNLTASFGADSETAQKGIRDIYSVITSTRVLKAETFFNQWKILFGEVCGYDVEGKNDKVKKLGAHYFIPDAKSAELLFSVHTYYAIFMKFLAAEIATTFSPLGPSVIKKCVCAPSSAKLRQEMENLEQGGIWSQLGITNFLEGDIFSWYLSAWDDRMAEAVRGVVRTLDQYDPTTLSVEPAESRDLLKKLYQHLFPKSVRHDLGEYYTPDWLAEHVLDELGYDGNPDKRVLDPACGSGTFLVAAINRSKEWFEKNRENCGYGEKELVPKILHNIIGFDLNPLAVMAARTNYLLAIRDLLKFSHNVELPVYLCDSIMTPSEYGELFSGKLGRAKELKTSAGKFIIPTEIAGGGEQMGRYAETIEFCVRNKYNPEEFITRCKDEGLPVKEKQLHQNLYKQLCKLDSNNQNGIWARIIKNAFAPLFIGQVDYVAGNPPWVNWESLPEEYRNDTKPLWQRYGLFTLSGSAGRLGGGKKDLSMLFVYSSVDNYLKDGGRIGFVITQTVFKTKGAGEGFRYLRFYSGEKLIAIKPIVVHDLSEMQVFEGATNRTAVIICEKNRIGFSYPVPYFIWHGPSRISQDEPLSAVKALTRRDEMGAIPIKPQVKRAPWLTAPTKALPGIQKIFGKSYYKAYAGSCTWLNGVYWVNIIKKLPSGELLIENLNDVGKIKLEHIQTVIEPDLVYPLLRGRDVSRWDAVPSAYIIIAQDPKTRAGIPEADMKRKYPKTYAYLNKFEDQLRNRSGYRKYFTPTDPFYSMYNIGPYTLAKWKVCWRDMGHTIQPAIVDGEHGDRSAIICPEHHVMFIPFSHATEAYYVLAVLASSLVSCTVAAYTTSTGISTHVLEYVHIRGYQTNDETHNALSSLGKRCNAAAAKGNMSLVLSLESEIDRLAAKLWGISDDELKAIQDAVKEMRSVRDISENDPEE